MYNYYFEWDVSKDLENQRKHGVAFQEAKSVFLDENAWEYFDLEHSTREDRFIMLGLSSRLRVLVVSFCHRKGESAIRLISARKANTMEEKYYGEMLP